MPITLYLPKYNYCFTGDINNDRYVTRFLDEYMNKLKAFSNVQYLIENDSANIVVPKYLSNATPITVMSKDDFGYLDVFRDLMDISDTFYDMYDKAHKVNIVYDNKMSALDNIDTKVSKILDTMKYKVTRYINTSPVSIVFDVSKVGAVPVSIKSRQKYGEGSAKAVIHLDSYEKIFSIGGVQIDEDTFFEYASKIGDST